jgi:hypothetical protein
MSSGSSTSFLTGVLISRYELAPRAILRAVENASSIVPDSSDEDGEYLAMSLVVSKPAADVPDRRQVNRHSTADAPL